MGKNQNPQELAKILFEFAYRHEMLGTPFKPRAYQLASEAVTTLDNGLKETWRKDGIKGLKELPGIGQNIAEKIDEFFRTGTIKEYEKLKKSFPVDIWGLSRVEGLGPKHIQDLYRHLKIKNVEDLKLALQQNKIEKIPRWGAKSQEKLKRGLKLTEESSRRLLLGHVLPLAEEMIAALSQVKGVKRCVIAGSLRRRQETIGDIDLIATSADPENVMRAFISLPQVVSVQEHGPTRSSVRLSLGIDADLRVVPDEAFGATLQYFTGDRRHNVVLRELALSQGYTLNEYGLFALTKRPIKHSKTNTPKPVVCATEDEIYSKLGLATPPPEIRVGDAELDAAREHQLPELLPYGSVRGDLHSHSTWTDGTASIREMAEAARALGREYLAVTDHSKALAFVHGLDGKALAEQAKEIDQLNSEFKDFTLFKGIECDILRDGNLDLPDEILIKLDWVGISIHSLMNLPREDQTKRILKALSNPNVCVFCHPTCRIIDKREPIEIDFDEILAAAKKHAVALEIDSYPDRSDLRDSMVRTAVRAGVKLIISTDAHHPDHLKYLSLGEAIARRGWAAQADVLNTKTAAQLKSFVAKKRK